MLADYDILVLPLFRGFWYAGRLLFANAVCFGGL